MHKLLLLLPILLLLSACSQQTARGPNIPYYANNHNASNAYSLEALDTQYQLSRGR